MDVITLLMRRQVWQQEGVQAFRLRFTRNCFSNELAICDLKTDVTCVAAEGALRPLTSETDLDVIAALIPSLSDYATRLTDEDESWDNSEEDGGEYTAVEMRLNVYDLMLSGRVIIYSVKEQNHQPLPDTVLPRDLAERLPGDGIPNRFELYAGANGKPFSHCIRNSNYVRCDTAITNFSETALAVLRDEIARMNREIAVAVQAAAECTGLDPLDPDNHCRVELAVTFKPNYMYGPRAPSITLTPYHRQEEEMVPLSVLDALELNGEKDIAWLDDAARVQQRVAGLDVHAPATCVDFGDIDGPNAALAYLQAHHDPDTALRDTLSSIQHPQHINAWQRFTLDALALHTSAVTLDQVHQLMESKSYGIVANKTVVLTPKQVMRIYVHASDRPRERYIYFWAENPSRTYLKVLDQQWERQTKINRWLYSHVNRLRRHIQHKATTKGAGWQQRHAEEFRTFVNTLATHVQKGKVLMVYRREEAVQQLETLRLLPGQLDETLLRQRTDVGRAHDQPKAVEDPCLDATL